MNSTWTNLKLSVGEMSIARRGVGRMIWCRPSTPTPTPTLSLSIDVELVDDGDVLLRTTHFESRISFGEEWPPSRILSMALVPATKMVPFQQLLIYLEKWRSVFFTNNGDDVTTTTFEKPATQISSSVAAETKKNLNRQHWSFSSSLCFSLFLFFRVTSFQNNFSARILSRQTKWSKNFLLGSSSWTWVIASSPPPTYPRAKLANPPNRWVVKELKKNIHFPKDRNLGSFFSAGGSRQRRRLCSEKKK